MLTLAIDAATYTGSVALLDGATVLAEREVAMRGEHEERLMPAVDTALRDGGASVRDVRRIVCGEGPGSFTSLRIAASIAKGIALATEAPLYAVSSLWLMIAGAKPAFATGDYAAVLDAMRGERYVASFRVSSSGLIESTGAPRLVSVAELRQAAGHATLVGAALDVDGAPHARGVARLGVESMQPVSLATWEPSYGRLAEAQVKWEAAHGRPLAAE